jgi:lysophospholipase L1-like esterase
MNKLIVILFLLSLPAMAQKLIVPEEVKFLALGDSYTIGESVPAPSRWPLQLTDSLSKRGVDCLEPRIIAKTGWRTDNLMDAIVRAKLKPGYSLVSLLIGVNNLYQGRSVESFAPEFEELLMLAIKLAGGNKSSVFVLSIPDYGYTPFGKSNQEKISVGIDTYNAMCKAISEKAGVAYFSITDISRKGLEEPDLVATDGLHPSEKMYAEWVERILADVEISHTDTKGTN